MSGRSATGSPEQLAVVDRFADACRRDPRVLAAFLGGSLAAASADEHSDLDLYVIASTEACPELVERHHEFVASFGEPVFTDVTRDFERLGFDMLHFVLASGVSGEVAIADPGSLRRTHGGAHRVLVDKAGLLEGVEFPLLSRTREERELAAERALAWFWLHLIGLSKRLAREQLWAAHAKLHELRGCLWQLLPLAGLPASEAQRHERALRESLVGFERSGVLAAVDRLVETYRALAPEVAGRCSLEQPHALAAVALAKLAATR